MDTLQTNTAQPVSPRQRLAPRWLLPLLALLLGGLTFSAYRLWSTRLPGEGSPEATFARDMGAHHEQAVEMAVIARDRATDEVVRTMAVDILLTQQAQVGMMQGWLQVWGLPVNGPELPMNGQGEMMGLASADDIASLSTLPVTDLETRFLQLMIRHHQGGVMMAQAALDQTKRPEVMRLATAIVNGQQSEINAFTAMLQRRGAALPDPVMPMPGHQGMSP